MPECPVCRSALSEESTKDKRSRTTYFPCPLCGNFELSEELWEDLPSMLPNRPDKENLARTKISHAIRRMQEAVKVPKLISSNIEKILERPLPSPKEQADLLIRWLAKNSTGPGEAVNVDPSRHRTIIGAKSDKGFAYVVKHLIQAGLINGKVIVTFDGIQPSDVTLSFKGWDYHDKLLHGKTESRKAFMAMQFGDDTLDRVFKAFTKYAADAGFELIRLDEMPKAGLIDDKLRVEIQSSAFLIADLTHENSGAYWEAGYAEGLGKAVIYSCEKKKFEKDKTHFDTNHHLTILWEESDLGKAGESLKATIRATLPDLAKQEG